MYIDDFQVTQELLAQTSAKKRRVTVPIKADFRAYVSAWQMTWSFEGEGVSVYAMVNGSTYDLTYMNAMEDDITFTPGLSVDMEHQKAIAAVLLEQGYYYEEGMDPEEDDPLCYGNPKWLGFYPEYLLVTFQFEQTFTGATVTLLTEPSSTDDPRGPLCVPNSEYYLTTNITVEGADNPAPTPTFDWNENEYIMEAVCADHDVVLMINGQEVANPYAVAQTYEEQTITFTAYTVANNDETANSAEVEMTVTVPAKAKTPSNKPSVVVTPGDNAYTIEATGTGTVELYVNGEKVTNPYTINRPAYGEDDIVVTAKASNLDSDPEGEIQYEIAWCDEVEVTVPALEPTYYQTPDPVITVTDDPDAQTVTITVTGEGTVTMKVTKTADDPTMTGEVVYETSGASPLTYTIPYGEAEAYYSVYATATAAGDFVYPGDATEPFVEVPAKPETPQPGEGNIYVKFTGTELPVGKKIIFVYENGANSLAMGTITTKGAPVAVVVENNQVDIANTDVVEFTVGGGEYAFGTEIKTYTLEYSAGFLAYNSGTNFKTLTSIGTYDSDAYWRLQTTSNGYTVNNNATASRYIRKHATNNNFGPYAVNGDSEEVVIYVEKSDEPVLNDLAGHIVFGEPTTDGKVAVSYDGDEDGVTVTVEGYEVVDGMIQLPDYGTYTLTATATAEGYNPLTEEGEVTWSEPVLPTLGGYFVWSVLDDEGHFTVEYKNFDYTGSYTLVVKDENGNVMNPEVGDTGEYYQAAEGTHTYTAVVTATGYQPRTENHEYTYTIPTYAPKPVLTWNEETFTMTASLPSKEYTTEDIKLYKDNELVENPYTVKQLYVPQTIMFKAYVPGEDGDNDSEYAYKEVTVPAKEKTPSAEPTISVAEGDDAYVITGNGTGTVVMYDAEGNEISNPYTVNRTDEKQIIIITVVNTDEDTEDVMYKPTSKTFTVEVPAKVVVTPPTAPQITIDTQATAIVVGATDVEGATVVLYQCDDVEGNNPVEIGNPTAFPRGETQYTVWVYATATNEAGEATSTVTEIVVPAKPVDPETAIDEMTAGKTIANVRYFNMAGQEMQEANGMTIVVTTYTDGTSSAVKVMK